MNNQRSISLAVSIAAVAGLEIATSSETTAFGMIKSPVTDCLDVVDLPFPQNLNYCSTFWVCD